MTTRRIAFVNEKGGTCKTTLAVHTAAYLAGEGARVLLADLDTQGHAGKSLGVDVRTLDHTVAELLAEPERDPKAFVRPTPIAGLDLLPANKRMGAIPETLAVEPDRHQRLRRVIDRLLGEVAYDYVVFDAPPSLGLVTESILVATEEVVVPVALTYFALDGCAEVVDTTERIRRTHGHDRLRVTAIVPTLVRNTRLAREVRAKLEAYFGERVTPSLGYNVKIDEAQSHGKTIWEYAPWSRGAHMLEAIAKAIRDRGGRG